jgi:heme oxygenase
MTLLQALRNATHASHQRLDRQISTEEITASRETYARYLERFHEGLRACWPQLDWELLARLGLPELPARQARYHALAADLHALGRPVTLLGVGSALGVQPATTIGCIYVLEGSIHGGAILLAELERTTGPLPADACGFIRGFGDQNRQFWKDFVSWLESLDSGDEFLGFASTAAVATFDRFIAALSAPSPTPVSSR